MALADCYGVRAAPSKAVENLEPPRHVAGFFAEHKVRARSLERQPLARAPPPANQGRTHSPVDIQMEHGYAPFGYLHEGIWRKSCRARLTLWC